jgi:hypothetical protein
MTSADFAKAAALPNAADEESEAERLQRDFYREVLNRAEQVMLPVADQIGGLDREISVLRVKLRQIMKRLKSDQAKTDDIKLMLRAMEMLNRLASTRYRLSKQSREDLADSVAALLQGARAQLGLGEDHAT